MLTPSICALRTSHSSSSALWIARSASSAMPIASLTPMTSGRLSTLTWKTPSRGRPSSTVRSFELCGLERGPNSPATLGPEPLSTEPDDLLDEELEAYAAEAELNLDDLQAEDIWSLSDFDDVDPPVPDAMQMD